MGLKHKILTLTLSCLLSSCVDPEKSPDIPVGILSPEEMRILLAEFAMSESAAVMNIKNTPLQHADSVYAFDPLTEHNIRKTQFDSSIQFYSTYPETYKMIYDSVLVTLSEMKARRTATSALPGSK